MSEEEYKFKISDTAINAIKKYELRSPGIKDALESLKQNPHSRLKRPKHKLLGDYYVKAGNKFALLFDLDESAKTIEVLACIKKTDLFLKIMTALKEEKAKERTLDEEE